MQPDADLLRESVGAGARDRGAVRWTRLETAHPAVHAGARRDRAGASGRGGPPASQLSDEAQSNVGAGEFAAYITRDLFGVGLPFASDAVIRAKRAARRA